MRIETIKTGSWKQNCFILINEATKKTIIIDPGDDQDLIIKFLEENNLHPLAIVNTHGHFDHVGAVQEIKNKYHIPFYLHANEVTLLKRANLYKMAFMKVSNIKLPTIDELILDTTKEIQIEDFCLKIHQTPGHTNGSICIEIDGVLFTGDTILESSLVPKNLPEENRTKLHESFKYLHSLNPELVVMPGHGKSEKLSSKMKFFEL